jgi:hypothetical protein
VLSPLIFNVAMSALDEHLHRPWKPGGAMMTSGQRARRRARGLPNWRICRYADERGAGPGGPTRTCRWPRYRRRGLAGGGTGHTRGRAHGPGAVVVSLGVDTAET